MKKQTAESNLDVRNDYLDLAVCDKDYRIRNIIAVLLAKYFNKLNTEFHSYNYSSVNEMLRDILEYYIYPDMIMISCMNIEQDLKKMIDILIRVRGYSVIILISAFKLQKNSIKYLNVFLSIEKKNLVNELETVLNLVLIEIKKRRLKTFFYYWNHKLVKILFKDIIYFEKYGDFLLIRLKNNENIKINTTISALTQSLPVRQFAIISSSIIVNTESIEKIYKNEVHLLDGRILHISRLRINELENKFAKLCC